MYKRLSKIRTKKRYEKIVNEMLLETEELIRRFPDLLIYQSIHNQVMDIKENVIEKKVRFSESAIQKRYNLGSIVVHNFDLDHEEYAQKLADIFGASCDYLDFIEGSENPSDDEIPPTPNGGWSVI